MKCLSDGMATQKDNDGRWSFFQLGIPVSKYSFLLAYRFLLLWNPTDLLYHALVGQNRLWSFLKNPSHFTVGIIQQTEEFEFPTKTVFANNFTIIDLRLGF